MDLYGNNVMKFVTAERARLNLENEARDLRLQNKNLAEALEAIVFKSVKNGLNIRDFQEAVEVLTIIKDNTNDS